MNYWETKGTILMGIALGLFLLMILCLGQCHASGEVSLILNDVVPTQDWPGSEKSSSALGLTADYNKSVKAGSMTTVSGNIKIDYSHRKIEGRPATGKDEIRCKFDVARDRDKIGVKTFLSAKTYTHFKSDKYNVYLKYGIGRAKSIPFVVQGTTKLIVLDYATKVSISQNWQENGAMAAKLGALLEIDAAIKAGNWTVSMDDGGIFFAGGRSIELPLAIEFVKRPLFVRQSWLVRGNEERAGCLGTFEAGIRIGIK